MFVLRSPTFPQAQETGRETQNLQHKEKLFPKRRAFRVKKNISYLLKRLDSISKCHGVLISLLVPLQ